MLRSLVSPMFIQEIGKARKRDQRIPPMPDGYSFKRVSSCKLLLMHNGVIVSTFRTLADIPEKVRNHQALLPSEGAS